MILLHNVNTLPSVPVALSVRLKEACENLLNKIRYHGHNWQILVTSKIMTTILEQHLKGNGMFYLRMG